MRRWSALLLLVWAGCSLFVGDSNDSDAGACLQDWNPQLFDPCALPAATADEFREGEYVLDTTTGALTDPDDNPIDMESQVLPGDIPVLLVHFDSLSIPLFSTLRAVGARPLILAVSGPIEIRGIVDASSYAPSDLGAGANTGECGEGTDGGDDESAGGGGGGGALQNNGGRGGDADAGGGTGGSGGTITELDGTLRGGCPGGNGGVDSDDANAGEPALGGAGGGGIQLSAYEQIVLVGRLTSSGAGGRGGTMAGRNGGGGGGSGGLIWLEAPDIVIDGEAAVFAVGGGGGEGGSSLCDGAHGADSGGIEPPAPGGETLSTECTNAGDPSGGNGGHGSEGDFGNPGPGDPGEVDEGGGGGGGSHGYIVRRSDTITQQGQISPPIDDL